MECLFSAVCMQSVSTSVNQLQLLLFLSSPKPKWRRYSWSEKSSSRNLAKRAWQALLTEKRQTNRQSVVTVVVLLLRIIYTYIQYFKLHCNAFYYLKSQQTFCLSWPKLAEEVNKKSFQANSPHSSQLGNILRQLIGSHKNRSISN